MPVQIRRALPQDAPIMTDICMRSKQSNGYDDEFMDACRIELTVTEDQLLQREYWVAEADKICGVVALDTDDDGKAGEVCAFFVDPEWKRKGIGRSLWSTLFQHASRKGLKSLYLEADPAAVPFYEALGFETVGHVPSGSIAGRLLPQMELELR